MSDDPNTKPDVPDDIEQTTDADKDKRVHLLVQRSTHAMLEQTRTVLRMGGLAEVPEPVQKLLLKDWTSDTLVAAGCTAIWVLLQPREPDRYGKKAEAHIAYIQQSGGYPPGPAGRLKAIDDIIGGAAEALRAAEAESAREQLREAKATGKGKAKR